MVHEGGTVIGVYDRFTFLATKLLDDVGCLVGSGVERLTFLTTELVQFGGTIEQVIYIGTCLLYTSPSPRD